MKNFIVVLTFLACVCVLALASSRTKRQRQHDLMGAYSPVPPMNAKTLQGSASGPFYFPQRQNHFDGSNANRWEQEYFVNDTFWKGPGSNAPVFLCVGGEGPAFSTAVAVDSVHCSNAVDWLPEVGALFLAVQHRYYGCDLTNKEHPNCPVDSLDEPTTDLIYLNSKQALADLAAFHEFATEKYGLSDQNKWVSWGGSYPGMLAGWFRLKFPNLVHAAIASSAPVHTKLEMQEYNDHVTYAFTVPSVGGSQECADAIANGHVAIGNLMNTDEGRAKLASLFPSIPSADWLKTKANQRAFAGEGVAYFPAQSNDPACTQPSCNIKSICEIMLIKGSDPVKQLAVVAKGQRGASYNANVEDGSPPDYWGWQTCNEMGFYQTCNVGSQCMYTQGLDSLADEMAFCSSDFKIDPSIVAQNVNNTDVYYGGLKPVGTRVMWPNGQVDPWSTLSILKSPDPANQPTLYVPGASHHFWTHPTMPTDEKPIVQARLAIRKQVADWLNEP